MLSRFHLIHRNITDGRTDRQTEFAISISRVSVLTRNKNVNFRCYFMCHAVMGFNGDETDKIFTLVTACTVVQAVV